MICVSEYLLGQLPGYIQKKGTFIYNGIDHYQDSRLTDNNIKEFRRFLNMEDDDVLLLYVGRLNLTNQPYKGLAELVDIYQR